jgi:CRP-like cAMP-binding protein
MYKTSVEQLKNIPLFTFVEGDDLNLIAEKLELHTFPANTLIIKEGEAGDCLYLLKSGRVKVYAQNNEQQEIVLTYLESGDHFGEMALISGEPRSASVVSVSDVEVWELNRQVFDSLIMNNPSITLTLTHLLTQRLKESNLARKESEEFYEQKFMPKGRLKDTSVMNLLKYAEDNSLSGQIVFEKEKDGDHAVFHYKKGHLVTLEFGDREEDEAMDILIEWEDGSYRIEPNIVKPESTKIDEKIEAAVQDDRISVIKIYIEEKLNEFVHFAGAKITQRALNRSYHTFKNFFDNIEQVKIQLLPEMLIEFKNNGKWEDKHTLLLAVLIRDVVEAIDRDAIGMMFWSPRSDINEINSALEELQYFEYYEQAMDIISS